MTLFNHTIDDSDPVFKFYPYGKHELRAHASIRIYGSFQPMATSRGAGLHGSLTLEASAMSAFLEKTA